MKKKVPWCSVAPVSPSYEQSGESLEGDVDLGNGVLMGPMPDWVRTAEVWEYFGLWQRKWAIEADLALRVEYEADSLSEPDPTPDPYWTGDLPRSNEDRNKERIQLATLALWIAQPSNICCEPIVHGRFRDGQWQRRASGEVLRLVPHVASIADPLDVHALAAAQAINTVLATLERDKGLWMGIHALVRALAERGGWEIRYLMFWIVLEALFGPESPGELSFRLSQRIAFFLAADPDAARDVYDTVKTGYAWRSKVVHGMHIQKLFFTEDGRSRSGELLLNVERTTRTAVERILADSDLVDTFSCKSREAFLNDLVFSRGANGPPAE